MKRDTTGNHVTSWICWVFTHFEETFGIPQVGHIRNWVGEQCGRVEMMDGGLQCLAGRLGKAMSHRSPVLHYESKKTQPLAC